MIKLFDYQIECIEILPFGAIMNTNIDLNAESKKVFLISIGGILFQIILFFIFYLLNKYLLISELTYNIFLKYNIFILIFNLLPIYPLDGLKILVSLLECFLSFNKSLVVGYFISCIFIIIFLVINCVYDLDNYIIIFFLFFKLFEYIRNYRYILNKFYVERYLSNRVYKRVNYIDSIKNIRKNYLNFINNVNEKKVLRDRLYKF